jgi:uncharacterized protein (TIGR00730 family)
MGLSVCVFCGSRFGTRSVYRDVAERVGTGIGSKGWRVIYGGGDVGLMKVVADAAMDAGGEVKGFIPRKLMDLEVGKRNISELVVNVTMFERKERMIAESDAFVVLPGGLGTLDELLEVMTLRQLRYHNKPIFLVEVEAFWRKTLDMFEEIVAEGFAETTALQLFELCEEPDRLLAMIEDRCAEAQG